MHIAIASVGWKNGKGKESNVNGNNFMWKKMISKEE